MKTNEFSLIVCALGLILGCSDSTTNPLSLDYLQARVVNGYIGMDYMPTIPPRSDLMVCGIDLRVQNTHDSKSIQGISWPSADVYLAQSQEKLGSIAFSTTWAGVLVPGQIDTVKLFKQPADTTPFNLSCGQYVYLKILMRDSANQNRSITTDSLVFGCTY